MKNTKESQIKRILEIINSPLSYIYDNGEYYLLKLPLLNGEVFRGSYKDYEVAYFVRRKVEHLELIPYLVENRIKYDVNLYTFLYSDPFYLIGSKFFDWGDTVSNHDTNEVGIVVKVEDISYDYNMSIYIPDVTYRVRNTVSKQEKVVRYSELFSRIELYTEYIISKNNKEDL